MGQILDRLTPALTDWIAQQHVFFVATAPTSLDGHVNCSPRGLDCLRVLDDRTVAWADLTGSGAETIAHLRDNGRIAIMFCAFTGPPQILRLHGRGRVLSPDDAGFAALQARLPSPPGLRAIVVVAIERVATSCGYGVPLLDFAGERRELIAYAERKGEDGLSRYRQQHNRASIDGLPALP